ncbi:MAG TPA: NAD(P)-dependent oxidoreductase [Thermodesulfobacteriota bacterium]
MTRKVVLLVQPIHPAGVARLESDFAVRVAPDPAPAALAREVADAAGIVVRTTPLPAEVIAAAPRLEGIARTGVGVDNIDMAAATRRRIPVVVTPGANTVSVAEHVVAAMAAVARGFAQYDARTRAGDWRVRDTLRAVDLDGKVIGIVGMGRIGRLVARKASAAFDMRVLGYDPLLAPDAIRAAGAEPAPDLDALLAAADVVSLHVPLAPATRGLLGREALARMKPSAILVNTSRGGIVDEAALAEALAAGRLLGAAIDVFDEEPVPAGHPLLALPNVLVTPHAAALTAECAMRMAVAAADGLAEALHGRRPPHVANPEIYAQEDRTWPIA